ncbi:MAG: hypothetical protein FJX75_13310 [Armatimonadetes bacterium]|nr:hypothetical protein [Armatimonadota bacterium]
MTPQYLYAIVPTEDRLTFEVVDLDDGPRRAHCLSVGGLAAVVDANSPSDPRGLPKEAVVRHLLAHERVVEEVMRALPVLPVKFGTFLPSKAAVCRLLEQNWRLFRRALNELAGRAQVEVVVLWDLEQAFRQIRSEEPIAGLIAEIAAAPERNTPANRAVVGQLVQAALGSRRAALQQHLLAALRALTAEVVLTPAMDDTTVLSVGLLLDESGREALDRELARLDEAFDGRLTFRCIGPLPPYSFATVQVQRPSYAEVEQARCLLGLGESAAGDDIRRAFRRLAALTHPDVNRRDPQAEKRMADLNQAYRLLMGYAEHAAGADAVPQASSAERPHECRFTREAVEGALLVEVSRQQDASEPALAVA